MQRPQRAQAGQRVAARIQLGQAAQRVQAWGPCRVCCVCCVCCACLLHGVVPGLHRAGSRKKMRCARLWQLVAVPRRVAINVGTGNCRACDSLPACKTNNGIGGMPRGDRLFGSQHLNTLSVAARAPLGGGIGGAPCRVARRLPSTPSSVSAVSGRSALTSSSRLPARSSRCSRRQPASAPDAAGATPCTLWARRYAKQSSNQLERYPIRLIEVRSQSCMRTLLACRSAFQHSLTTG